MHASLTLLYTRAACPDYLRTLNDSLFSEQQGRGPMPDDFDLSVEG